MAAVLTYLCKTATREDDGPEISSRPVPHLVLAQKVGLNMSDRKLMAEFEKGLEVEKEHSAVLGGDELKIAKVVRDHLKEMKNYYTELAKMESQEKKGSLAKQAAASPKVKAVGASLRKKLKSPLTTKYLKGRGI